MDYLILSMLYMMPDTEPTTELQFHLKHPSLNWEGNLYDNFKSFEYCARVLLEGPYKNTIRKLK